MRPGAASIAYRVATYIVISKPKRMSWKDGLDHCIATSWSCALHPVRHIVLSALRSHPIIRAVGDVGDQAIRAPALMKIMNFDATRSRDPPGQSRGLEEAMA